MNTISTQNPTLQIGAQGAAVKMLQQLLNQRVSRDYLLTVDGIFGAKTKQTVEVFQYSKLLRRDGIVGPKTWEALQTNMAPTMPTIRQGSKGEAVAIAQALLKEAGIYKGAVDSHFGPQTEMAVRLFQTNQNLASDGVIGNKTWAALSNLATYLAFD
jgi:peptidoglycan hydrolase-like protein with peptidoglycan-binding domain